MFNARLSLHDTNMIPVSFISNFQSKQYKKNLLVVLYLIYVNIITKITTKNWSVFEFGTKHQNITKPNTQSCEIQSWAALVSALAGLMYLSKTHTQYHKTSIWKIGRSPFLEAILIQMYMSIYHAVLIRKTQKLKPMTIFKIFIFWLVS